MRTLMTSSEALRRVFASLFIPPSPIPAAEGPRVYFSSPSGGTGSGHQDHHGHDHEDHAGHNDHDDHNHHDHDDHAGHNDHDDHAGYGHGRHDHAHDLRGASRRNLIIALTLISTYMLAEVVGESCRAAWPS